MNTAGEVVVELDAFCGKAYPWTWEHKIKVGKEEKSVMNNQGKVKDMFYLEITPEVVDYLKTHKCDINPLLEKKLDTLIGRRVLLCKFSNRRSAYDGIVGEIDGIGIIQREVSSLLFKEFQKEGMKTHYIASDGDFMMVEEMDRYNLEVVGRRAITGSFAERLRKNGKVEVMRLKKNWFGKISVVTETWTLDEDGKFVGPTGKAYAENEVLDEPIVEFSTKREEDSKTGHDEYMEGQYKRILRVGGMKPKELYHAYKLALGVEKVCQKITKKAGVILKDFKIEVGKRKGYKPKRYENPKRYMKILDSIAPDEVRTDPDFGKQPFRDKLKELGWTGPESGKPPAITPEMAEQQLEAYGDFLRILRNVVYPPEIKRKYLTGRQIIILSGSEGDGQWVKKIEKELEKQGIYSVDRVLDALNGWTDEKLDRNTPVYEWRIRSAHRNDDIDKEIFEKYKKMNTIYITVAGLSDALSGVVASRAGRLVIACPPKPKEQKPTDSYGVSTIDAPPGVALAFVPQPENAALFGTNIFNMQDKPIRVAIIDGAEDDKQVKKIQEELEKYGIHKAKEAGEDKPVYEIVPQGKPIGISSNTVYISVNGLEDNFQTLNGLTIVCPAKPEDYRPLVDAQPMAVTYVPRPENAALFAAEVLSMRYDKVYKKTIEAINNKAKANVRADIKARSKY